MSSDDDDSTYQKPSSFVLRGIEGSLTSGTTPTSMDEFDEIDCMLSPRPSTAKSAALIMVNSASNLDFDDDDSNDDDRGATRRREPLRTNSEHRSSPHETPKTIDSMDNTKRSVSFRRLIDERSKESENSNGHLFTVSPPLTPVSAKRRFRLVDRRFSVGTESPLAVMSPTSSKALLKRASAALIGRREHMQQKKSNHRYSLSESNHSSIASSSGHKSSYGTSSSLFGAELDYHNVDLYGRDKEIQKLDELLLQRISKPYNCRKRAIVAISGKAGVGKTFLMQSRLEKWTSPSYMKSLNIQKQSANQSDGGDTDDDGAPPARCLFASGRFNLHASSSAPLSAITDAMTELVQLWLDATTASSQSTGSKFKEIVQLVAFLKGNESNLREVLPRIYEMVGVGTKTSSHGAGGTRNSATSDDGSGNDDDDVVDSVKRASASTDTTIHALRDIIFRADRILLDGSGHVLKMALGRLLSFLCRRADRPVVLFFDAIQRADAASLDMIKFFATAKQANNLKSLLLVVCFRDEEVYPPVNCGNNAHPQQQNQDCNDGDPSSHSHPIASIVRQHPHYQKQQQLQQQVDDGRHPVAVMLQDIEDHYGRDPDGGGCVLHRIFIDTLDLDAVNKLVSHVIERDKDETPPLSKVVHQKTGGNPFYVLQFLRLLQHEELLKYSFKDFHWEWGDVETIQNATMLSQNVADIVAKSILRLPKETQQTLLVASCLGDVVPVTVLREFFARRQEKAMEQKESDDAGVPGVASPSSFGSSTSPLSAMPSAPSSSSYFYDSYFLVNEARVVKCLKVAVRAGILTHSRKTSVYQWSHDKVQHSANSLVPDAVRGSLHLGLGQILWQMGRESPDQEWMVYMAADQINKGTLAAKQCGAISDIELAELNLQAAQLSVSRSAFIPATEMLRKGVQHLLVTAMTPITSAPNPSSPGALVTGKQNNKSDDIQKKSEQSSPWMKNYALCLEMFNLSAEMEFALGQHEAAMASVNQVLENARTREDKFRAQSVLLQCLTSGKSRDYGKGVSLSIEILKSYGETVPLKPTAYQMYRQRKKVRRLYPNGCIESLLDLPDMVDQSNLFICRLLAGHLARYANFQSSESCLPCFAARRVIQLSIKFGVAPDTCLALLFVATRLKEDGEPKLACDYAELAMRLLKRYDESPGSIHAKLKTRIYAAILPTQRPFHESLDELMDAYRIGLRTGDMEGSSMGAMCYAMCYICTGLKLTPLESDVESFGREANQFGRPLSFVAVFHIIRQTILNLQTYNRTDPTKFVGKALNQEEILDKLEGLAKKMTLRDICTFRLMLACIYGNLDAMENLVEIVISFPSADLLEIRGHLRRTYIAIAAVILGQERRHKKLAKLGKKLTKEFKQEVRKGSVNAYPIWLMLVALRKPTKARFDESIKVCARSGLKHHEAFITERCGVFFKNDVNDSEWAGYYLRKAVSLWEAYGAPGKVQQINETYDDIGGSSEAQVGTDLSGRRRHVRGLAERMQTFRILSTRALVPAMDDDSSQ